MSTSIFSPQSEIDRVSCPFLGIAGACQVTGTSFLERGAGKHVDAARANDTLILVDTSSISLNVVESNLDELYCCGDSSVEFFIPRPPRNIESLKISLYKASNP
ncbi:hypothetical protein GJ496_000761 [Pomphorhynchus laevis]|nr:hypothetical protein GJ496_000761 [Pomphorhynchus laevis]